MYETEPGCAQYLLALEEHNDAHHLLDVYVETACCCHKKSGLCIGVHLLLFCSTTFQWQVSVTEIWLVHWGGSRDAPSQSTLISMASELLLLRVPHSGVQGQL